LIEQMLHVKSWGYARIYWPNEPNPFACNENVMWLGHLLAMVTFYEVLLGDARFRNRIAVRDTEGNEFVTDTATLAAHVAKAYRTSPRGGMCCEPGLVFFYCQNHALQGLYLEEQLSGTSFADILKRWENYAMANFAAFAGGAIQLVEVGCLSLKLPVKLGHLGGDGWAIAYWCPWSKQFPVQVWYGRVRPLLDEALPSLLAPIGSVRMHGPSTATCATLDIPRTPTIAYLFSAAAAVGDSNIADKLGAWLRSNAEYDAGSMWIPEGRDWSASCTAQMLFGLSWLRGATLRDISCLPGGHQLTGAEGAQVLHAEPCEDGVVVGIEPIPGFELVRICTNFDIKCVRWRKGHAVQQDLPSCRCSHIGEFCSSSVCFQTCNACTILLTA